MLAARERGYLFVYEASLPCPLLHSEVKASATRLYIDAYVCFVLSCCLRLRRTFDQLNDLLVIVRELVGGLLTGLSAAL